MATGGFRISARVRRARIERDLGCVGTGRSWWSPVVGGVVAGGSDGQAVRAAGSSGGTRVRGGPSDRRRFPGGWWRCRGLGRRVPMGPADCPRVDGLPRGLGGVSGLGRSLWSLVAGCPRALPAFRRRWTVCPSGGARTLLVSLSQLILRDDSLALTRPQRSHSRSGVLEVLSRSSESQQHSPVYGKSALAAARFTVRSGQLRVDRPGTVSLVSVTFVPACVAPR
jgi:hypothetical protein